MLYTLYYAVLLDSVSLYAGQRWPTTSVSFKTKKHRDSGNSEQNYALRTSQPGQCGTTNRSTVACEIRPGVFSYSHSEAKSYGR